MIRIRFHLSGFCCPRRIREERVELTSPHQPMYLCPVGIPDRTGAEERMIELFDLESEVERFGKKLVSLVRVDVGIADGSSEVTREPTAS